jgi:glycosyltransferase involved in cell wall biosynthesis
MNSSFNYLPQNERKKIMLICDDIRVHSGVATVARELVLNTAQHFNWVNIAGAINHPEKGKRFDISIDTNTNTGLTDASVFLYPVDGYGNPDLIRQLIQIEKPDAIMLITDPRYFEWLFMIENEIRQEMPIIYLNIWDDYPAPLYNKSFYESCDALLAISKQTKLINELVLGEKAKNKVIEYVPHGLNHEMYYPIEKEDELKELEAFKKQIFGNDEKDFVVFFNSRNIRRKQIPDTMLAFRLFLDTLPKAKAEKCAMIMHTEIVSDHGTDLEAVRKILFPKYPKAIYFSTNKLDNKQLNQLYNLADAQILLTSNEGWGLSLTEAILAGTVIIANVTGGMQDQMRFENEHGNWFTPSPKIPSNHTGRYKNHGSWAFPVYPTNRSIQGSPKTPYIWDDRCTAEDAAARISEVYALGREMRKDLGKTGRHWAVNESGFTAEHMGVRAIYAIDKLFNTWTPREKYELINVNEIKEDTIDHEFVY